MGWVDIEYKVKEIADERINAVVRVLEKELSNGGVFLRAFEPLSPEDFDLANRSDLKGLDHLLRCFLGAKSVRDSIPELGNPFPMRELPKFVWYSTYEFEGAITRILLSGGAYTISPPLSSDEARRMSKDFVDALVGSERAYSYVYRIDEAWTDWFFDIAWDSSFAIFQSSPRLWVLFCTTDTD